MMYSDAAFEISCWPAGIAVGHRGTVYLSPTPDLATSLEVCVSIAHIVLGNQILIHTAAGHRRTWR